MPYLFEIQSLLEKTIITAIQADRLQEMHETDAFTNIMPYELIAKHHIEPMGAICYSREQLRALHMYSKNIIAGELSVETVLIVKRKLLDRLISGDNESAEKLYALQVKINPAEEHQPFYNDIQRLLVMAFHDEILTYKISIDTALELENSLKMLAMSPKNIRLRDIEMQLMTLLIKYVVKNTETFLRTNKMVESCEWQDLAPYVCLRLFGHAHHPCPESESIYFSTFLRIAKEESLKTLIAPIPWEEETSLPFSKMGRFFPPAAAAAGYLGHGNSPLARPLSSFW